MTAGSMVLVPPMGAPPPSSRPAIPIPSPRKPVCRNIFGPVDRGSVESELRNELQSKAKKFMTRYVDIRPLELEQPEQRPETQLPSLIELDQKVFEKRLNEQKNNKNDNNKHKDKDSEAESESESDKDEDEETQREQRGENQECNSISDNLRENAERTPEPHRIYNTNNSKRSQQRSQPYARQKLISECYTTRKATPQYSLSEREKHRPDLWERSSASGMLLSISSPSSPSTELISINIQQQHQQQQQQQQKKT